MSIFVFFSLLVSGIYANKLIDGKEIRAYIEVGESQVFEIDMLSLKANTKYEARISYLGTVAGHFSINWDCWTGGRRLLDTEKLVFLTDENKKIIEGCHRILVKATRNSRGSSKASENSPIWFNIKLESYSSSIPVPNSVVPLVIYSTSLIIFIPCLFWLLKSKLSQVSSDLKLHSNKLN